ncbi:DUF3892 domain-containing protein [Mucilaginibacter sp. BJC16-A38]|uniref:DUF3892 domain-containing protein n=1 Tax=Mucilaginibacter phenanthrenivorans TaxID=1234842 RepID=UPI00358F23E3|nr:DUF3892 domain-containing protein [Mucilaginibacter phenanthrenivorans]
MGYKITHVRLSSGGYAEEHITDVKGVGDSGGSFTETVAQVVSYLKMDMKYYVSIRGYTITVIHQKSSSGKEYIRTKPDSTTTDNLLSLDRF